MRQDEILIRVNENEMAWAFWVVVAVSKRTSDDFHKSF